MTSFTGSLTTFRGEPKDEGPAPKTRFINRGDPVLLLGDSGGALPAGNMEGNELPAVAFAPVELPAMFRPDLASSIKFLTYKQCKPAHTVRPTE